MRRKTNLKNLLVASAIVVAVLATPSVALKYPPDPPSFISCDNIGWVVWEFIDDGCMPTSDEFDPPYNYCPGPADELTFGSRHFDPIGGWGSDENYGFGFPWDWNDGVFTVLSEDAITQPIPERGQKQYLRQYFEVVHTLVPGLDDNDYRWPIGLAVELWDMSAEEYPPDGWTGCPMGYESQGYLNGAEFSPPEIHYELGDGWWKSVWINDFDEDGSLLTENATEVDLSAATHIACIVGMDLDPEGGEIFQMEEVTLDFIWFDDPCGNDIPTDPAGSIIGLSSVQIDPPQPSSSDVIGITLSGEWSNTCTPFSSFAWIIDDKINFEVIPSYSCMCGATITPWELTDYIGPLSSGTYTIYGYMYRDPNSPVSDPYTFVVSDHYYVDAVDGDDLNDGLSWETAFATIQKGIDVANPGDTVIVGDGIYTGPGNRDLDFLGKQITVRSENGPDNCIISCNFEGRGFYFHNDEDASSVADGFTIVAGTPYYCDPCDPCCAMPISTYGGGIKCEYDSSPIIRNCIISDSYASFGGGVYCTGSPTIMNCLIYNNSGVNGAGIWVSTNMKILNCTIVDNSSWNSGSGAVDGMNGQVTNSILWGNTPNQIEGNSTVMYSDVQGGWPGEGNIDADPMFVDPNNGDYNLLYNSLCIDAGTNSTVPSLPPTDIDGNPRIVNGIVDMGAYEYQGIIYYVDDDAPGDPGPGDPDVSDPAEDGTEAHPFDEIQEGIDAARGADTVLVHQGLYLGQYPAVSEEINFSGKNITLTSAEPADPNKPVIRGAVRFDGTENSNCTLTGFRICDLSFGAIYGNGTQATISHCIITGNGPCSATVLENCDGIISNCLITDNMTIHLCGVYPVIFGCHGTIKNCTIANNASGISILDGAEATIENCIIYYNDESFTSQLSVGTGGILNISYCDVQGGLGGISGAGTVNPGPGNIDTDPCFAYLGYWQEEPYELVVEGDYHLMSQAGRWDRETQSRVYDDATSRCIDAGNPGYNLGDEANDPNNVRIDMGAYGGTAGASTSPHGWALLADLTNDRVVDLADFAWQAKDWLASGTEQPGDLNRDGIVDITDAAMVATDWLEVTTWSQ